MKTSQHGAAPLAAHHACVLAAASVTFLLFISIGITIPVMPRWVERELGGDDADIGMLVAVYAVVAIACRPVVGRIGRGGLGG